MKTRIEDGNKKARWIRWSVLAAATAVAAFPTGCGGRSAPSEPVVAVDSLAIASIAPPTGSRLAPGSTVDFQTVIHYGVREALGGGIGAQMSDQSGNLLANIFPTTAVPPGIGSVTLSSTFQIPASGASRIDISYILYATPGATTQIVAATKASYPVGR